jgi:hypothetical protein
MIIGQFELAVKIIPKNPCQFLCSFSKYMREVFQIIASDNTSFPYKILCGTLQVAIRFFSNGIFLPAKVRVR